MFGSERREKRIYFKAKLNQVKRFIWDLEFSRAKLRTLKEQMRQQYDRLKETSAMAETQLEAEKAKEKPDQAVMDNLKKVLEKYAPDIEYLTKQMEGVDNAIETQAVDEKGNPVGVNPRIEAARAMKQMLQDYMKTL